MHRNPPVHLHCLLHTVLYSTAMCLPTMQTLTIKTVAHSLIVVHTVIMHQIVFLVVVRGSSEFDQLVEGR